MGTCPAKAYSANPEPLNETMASVANKSGSLTTGSTRSTHSSMASNGRRYSNETRMAGNIRDVGHQPSIGLHQVNDIAAHFCAGDRFAVNIETRVLKGDGWHER